MIRYNETHLICDVSSPGFVFRFMLSLICIHRKESVGLYDSNPTVIIFNENPVDFEIGIYFCTNPNPISSNHVY